GNTPAVYLLLLATISALNAVLAYVLIRRASGPALAVAISIAMFAVLPIPGAIIGAFTSSPFIALERTLLLLTAATWKPPRSRGRADAFLLGGIFGVWQTLKFGGAVFVGAALLILDALVLSLGDDLRASLAQWLKNLLEILLSLACVELLLIVWAF